jgi:glycine cleavage system H protein
MEHKMYPTDRKYSKEHEWLRVEGDCAVLGIIDFAQRELGDIVYVELPSVGTRLATMEAFGNVESVKSVSDLYSPIGGVVADINTRLTDNPELVNSDAYGEGWMVRLEPADPLEIEQLLTADEYADFIGAERE